MTAAPSLQRWTIREADVCDVGAIVSLALEEWKDGPLAARYPNRKAFEDALKPVLVAIIADPETRIILAVDAEFSGAIWGCAILQGDRGVYVAFVKRTFRKVGVGGDVMRGMLGDRLQRQQFYAHDIQGLKRCGVEPARGMWLFDASLLGQSAWVVK